MADLQAQISITADTTGVEAGVGKAKRSLADLGVTAKAAGQQASDGLAKIGGGASDSAAKAERATASLIASIQRTVAQMQAGEKASSSYYAALGAQRGVSAEALKPYLDQLDAVSPKATAAGHASAGLTRELIVLGHEASQGNFSKFGGSLLVLAEYGTRAAAVLSALAVPGAVLAGVAAFGATIYRGKTQLDDLNKSLLLTGNYAGVSANSFRDAGQVIATSAKTGIGTAIDALQAVASSGAFGPELLTPVSTAVVNLSRITGQSADEIVSEFAKMGGGVAKYAAEHVKQNHAISAAQYEEIKSLEDAGKATAAQTVYFDALNAKLSKNATFWDGVTQSISGYLQAVRNIGQGSTVDRQPYIAQGRLSDMQTKLKNQIDLPGASFLPGHVTDADIADQKAIIASLQSSKSLADQVTKAVATSQQDQAKAIAGSDIVSAIHDRVDKQAGLTKEIEKYTRAVDAMKKVNDPKTPSAVQQAADIQGLKDAALGKPAAPRNTDRASLRSDVDAIKAAESARLDAYRDAESIFSQLRSEGLLSDQAYYAQERNFIEQDAAARTKSIDDQIAAEKRKTFTGAGAANEDFVRQGALAKLEADRAKVRQDADTKETRLSLDKAAALRALSSAQMTADLAAQRSLEQTQKQYDIDLASARMGPQEAAAYQARLQLVDRYSSELQALNDKRAVQEEAGTSTETDKSKYDADFARIQTFQQKSLESYDAYYSARKQQDGDYQIGLDRATATYIENAQNVAKLTEQAYTNTFSSIEDALVGFVTTGKLNFKSLADSIIADFVRIEIKQQESKLLQSFSGGGGDASGIFGLLGTASSLFSGSYDTNYGHEGLHYGAPKADGGSVGANSLQLVNERGPELLQSGGKQYLMMGSQGGNVVPNGGSGGTSWTLINQTSGRVDKMTETQISPTERALIIQEAAHQGAELAAHRLYDPNSANSKAQRANFRAERVR